MELSEIVAALAPDPAGGFSVEVAADWNQGRTVYGGLNAALAAHAARQIEDESGPLRALQIAFMAPSAGRVRYVPTVLRRGRSVTFVGVDCLVGDTLCNRAILTYGRARESVHAHQRLLTPTVAPPDQCPRDAPKDAPVFLQHMELRFASGSPPLSGGDPEFAMWGRHLAAEGLDPEVALLAIADLLPPAVIAASTEFRPASTITWTIDVAEPPTDPNGWYLLTIASDQASAGYSSQAMACFGADGRLAAVSRQTVAAF